MIGAAKGATKLAMGVSKFAKKKGGQTAQGFKQPTYGGGREKYATTMNAIEESLYDNIPAVRGGSNLRAYGLSPATDRRGVARIHRGDSAQRAAARVVAANRREKVKKAAMKKRVKQLARKRELEAKSKSKKG